MIGETGAQLMTTLLQTPDNSLNTQEKNELTVEVLSDVRNHIIRSFSLVLTMPADLQYLYHDFSLDVSEHSETRTFDFPMHATYLIDKISPLSMLLFRLYTPNK